MSSGYDFGTYCVSGATVNDRNRDSRPLCSSEWHVVAVVRERRPAHVRADFDYFVPQLHVRGDNIRPEAAGGRLVRKHFGKRKTRSVTKLSYFTKKYV